MKYVFKVSTSTFFPQIILADCCMWDLISKPMSNDVGNCDSTHHPQ